MSYTPIRLISCMNSYNYVNKLYKFYLLTYLFVFVLLSLGIEDAWVIMPLYIIFALTYFEAINFNQAILASLIFWYLYENKYIEYIQNRLEMMYIQTVASVHLETKDILKSYMIKNKQHPLFNKINITTEMK